VTQHSLFVFGKKYTVLLLFLLVLFIVVFRSWEKAVPFSDQLSIEDAAYSMVHGASWIIPNVYGQPVLAKPPLIYWLTAPLYTFLPVVSLTPRIPMIIFGLLLAWLLYQSAKIFYGKATALWATLFLITSAPFIILTKAANFDLPNAFFGLLTLYLYNRSKSNYRFLYLAGISFGLGILTRSFLAFFPAPVIGIDFLLTKKHPPISVILAFCSLVLLVILPWHLLAYYQNPSAFISLYLRLPVIYHTVNYVPGDKILSPLYYFNIFLLFPSTIFALLYFFSKIRSPLSSIDRQIFAYCVLIFLFLSISPTRHEWYIFPIYPALSILAGAFLASMLRKTKRQTTTFFLLLLFTLTSIISTPILLLSSPLPQAESINAVRVMEKNSTPQDTLYLYRYPLIWQTRFFLNNRRVEIIQQVDEKMLKDNKTLFILIRTQDTPNLSNLTGQQVLYQADNFSLVTLEGKKK